MKVGIKCNDIDNVAVCFAEDAAPGDVITVKDKHGDSIEIAIAAAVPFGHKIAICDIAEKESIIKYGEQIGRATCNIKKGDYVHVHNLESCRARGDWEK